MTRALSIAAALLVPALVAARCPSCCSTTSTTTTTTAGSTTTTSTTVTTTTTGGSTTTTTGAVACLAAVPRVGKVVLYYLSASDASTVLALGDTGSTSSDTGYNGLARHPSSHVLYAIRRVATVRSLVTISEVDASQTSIGTLTVDLSGIAFKADGTLLGIASISSSNPNHLYSINTSTAAETDLAALGASTNGNALTVRGDGFLYRIIADNPATMTILSKVDLGTFVETTLGNLTGIVSQCNPESLTELNSTVYYGQGCAGDLYTVNTGTLAATHLGTPVHDMKGLAPTAVCP